ncbi:TolC family protein [Paludibacter sp.]|uniref:TolC family protein n=1 Tax=Paludibacter sp. TaxID=1898105 RepID=UPI001353BDC4|nr:TolC family protein [Paludibacter sp.]MTK51951.1 TolC family protein [Paludibacter sp.]
MRTRISLLLLFVCTFGHYGKAQEKLSLSLEDARLHAQQYNRTLKNAGLSVQEAQSALWESISKGLPQIEVTGAYQNYLGASANFQGMKIQFGHSGSIQTQVSQLLFNGSYWIGLQLSKLSREIAETSKRKTEQDVIQQVTTSYNSILVSERTTQLLKQNKENLLDIQKRTQATVNAGAATQTDADQIAVQVSSVDNMIKSNERQTELAYNMLRIQLGVNANTTIELKDSLSSLMNEDKTFKLLGEQFDMSKNPTMQLTEKQLELSKKQVNLQKASWLPTLSGYYSYTYKYIKPTLDLSPSSVVGLQASWPLFTSGGTYSKVKQAKFQVQANENNLAALKDQLMVQEKQARFNLSNALDKLNTQTKSLEVSNKVFADISRKHDHGMATSLDVTSASNNLLQVQTNYVTALYEVLTAKTDLEQLLNKF